MQPTEQQLNHFHTFGFVAFRQLFAPDEVSWITEELNRSSKSTAAAMMDRSIPAPFRRSITVRGTVHCLMTPVFSALLPHFWAMTSIMPAATPISTLAIPVGTPTVIIPICFAIKLAFYLDPLTRDTVVYVYFPAATVPTPHGEPRGCNLEIPKRHGVCIHQRFLATLRWKPNRAIS